MAEQEQNIFNHLILNKGFIEWVRNPNEASDFFWEKWLKEKPAHSQEFYRAKAFVEKMWHEDNQMSNSELDDLLGKIIQKENTTDGNRGSSRKIFSANVTPAIKKLANYAAVFAIVITTLLIYDTLTAEKTATEAMEVVEWEIISNPKGKRSKITLPDGTLVDLNYESTLKYPKKFDSKTRLVELHGEAFFDVVHIDDYPFIVKTDMLETEVFGTSFNINSFSYLDDLDISLVTGKVKVRKTAEDAIATDSIFLSPGEQVQFNKVSREMVKNEFDVETAIAWKNGTLIFKEVGFDDFIVKLERWYGVNFHIKGTPPKNWSLNGTYQNEKIEDILRGIKFIYGMNYNYDHQGKNITITF
ncbi:FecR family protein [Flagellimonas iocasae]|uniref:FecR family protein n=1 Tax=Flagellimonas iocasae TaxID=2055905 RepID=A0ABW4XVT8_9FLAO